MAYLRNYHLEVGDFCKSEKRAGEIFVIIEGSHHQNGIIYYVTLKNVNNGNIITFNEFGDKYSNESDENYSWWELKEYEFKKISVKCIEII